MSGAKRTFNISPMEEAGTSLKVGAASFRGQKFKLSPSFSVEDSFTYGAVEVYITDDSFIIRVPENVPVIFHRGIPNKIDKAINIDHKDLFFELSSRLNEGELRTLCMLVDVDYDSLPDEGKDNKLRELLDYLNRRNALSTLINVIRAYRPDIFME